jgi:enediyne biosynthesis protein E4
LHFGLGVATSADIEVFWPNGLHETFRRVSANRLVTLREGSGLVANKGWSRS